MRTHRFGPATRGGPSYVVTFYSPWYGRSRNYVPYTFRRAGEKAPLFEGRDFSPSPLFAEPDGRRAALELLNFLTLQPGDVDLDYFADYSPTQHEWAASSECAYLSWFVSDLTEWHDNRR